MEMTLGAEGGGSSSNPRLPGNQTKLGRPGRRRSLATRPATTLVRSSNWGALVGVWGEEGG